MPPRPGKTLFPNPFYVLLLLASTLFVVTALAYLVSPMVLNAPGQGPGAFGKKLAAWLDRRGPFAISVEVAVMIAAGVLAMATDRWFPERNRPRGRAG